MRELRGKGSSTSSGRLEAMTVKVLTKDTSSGIQELRIELSLEDDLFFHFRHDCNASIFAKVRARLSLLVEFPDYPSLLTKMLENCVKEPHGYLAILIVQEDGNARLRFIQVRCCNNILFCCQFSFFNSKILCFHLMIAEYGVSAR